MICLWAVLLLYYYAHMGLMSCTCTESIILRIQAEHCARVQILLLCPCASCYLFSHIQWAQQLRLQCAAHLRTTKSFCAAQVGRSGSTLPIRLECRFVEGDMEYNNGIEIRFDINNMQRTCRYYTPIERFLIIKKLDFKVSNSNL